MVSSLMSGISVVKRLSVHIGKITTRILTEWYLSLIPVMKKELMNALRSLMPFWPRKHCRKFPSLCTPTNKTYNSLLKLKRFLAN